jgi:hypothetical protein
MIPMHALMQTRSTGQGFRLRGGNLHNYKAI